MLVFATATLLAQTSTVTTQNADYSAAGGSSNSLTLNNASINAVGDVVVFSSWCYLGCTSVGVMMGGQAATTVSGSLFKLMGIP